MTLKRGLLWGLVGAVALYLVLLLLMTPVRSSSGGGEGNVITTRAP